MKLLKIFLMIFQVYTKKIALKYDMNPILEIQIKK